jgi:transposase
MFALSAATRIYFYTAPCDMRKSFDGLCGLIRTELSADPLSGSLFVFCNRRRNMVKLIYWASDGFVIWFKRLERGCFNLPVIVTSDARIDRRQLSMLLEGVVPKKFSKRYIREQ